MRIWSLHPQYLDRQGLTACWREALLAQAVLAGRTKGYRHHPQLLRFRAHGQPLAAVGAYLWGVADEASARGYRYDRGRILTPPGAVGVPPVALEVPSAPTAVPAAPSTARGPDPAPTPTTVRGPAPAAPARIPVTTGQLAYEWGHLMAKLRVRSPERARELADVADPLPHPLFTVEPGPVADWEIVTA